MTLFPIALWTQLRALDLSLQQGMLSLPKNKYATFKKKMTGICLIRPSMIA